MDSSAALLDKLRSLPASTNPYEFLGAKLAAVVLPKASDSTINQMYFLAALLALIAVLAATSLGLRLYKRVCWIARYDSRLSLIQPHGAVSWALFSLLAIALLEVLTVRYIRLYQGRPYSDTGYFIFAAWASVWVAGSIAIWSIGASLFLHLAATGHKVRNRHALFVNIAGIATPVLVIAAALPLAILGGRYYGRIFTDYRTVQQNLARQAQAWSPGDALDLAALLADAPALESLNANVAQLGRFARTTYIFYTVITFLLGVALASIGGFFLVTLRRVLNRSNAMFSASMKEEGHRRVKRSLNSLVLTLLAFTLLDAGCFAVSLYGAFDPLSLAQPSVSTALTLAPLYLFAFLGLPCSVLLVHGAYYAEAADKAGTTSSSTRKGASGLGAPKRATTGRDEEPGSAMVTVVVDVDVFVDEEYEGKEKLAF